MLTLRPAEPADEERLLEWRNDATTRAASFTPGEVDSAGHRRWFKAKLEDPGSAIFIGERDGNAVGQIRLERLDGEHAEVHIAVAPEARGQGVARELLEAAAYEASRALGVRLVRALVKPDNEPSLRAFRSAGYEEAERDEQAVVLTLALPAGGAVSRPRPSEPRRR